MILNHPHIRFVFSLIKITFSISFLILVTLNYFVCEKTPVLFLFVFGVIGGIFLGFSLLYVLIKSKLMKDNRKRKQ